MQVNIPNVGLVNFPDTMSHEQVADAIKTKILPQHQAKQDPDAGFSPEMRADRAKMRARIERDINPPPQLSEAHPSWWQRTAARLTERPYGSIGYNLGTSMQTGIDPLFKSSKPVFEEPTAPPKTKMEALGQLGKEAVNMIATPGGMAGLALGPATAEANPAAQALLHRALGLAFAPTAGEQIGLGTEQLTRPGATGAERITGGGQAALGSLMGLGTVAPFLPKKLPVVPEHLKEKPGRELTVDERNKRAGLTPREPAKRVFHMPSGAEVGEKGPFDRGKLFPLEKQNLPSEAPVTAKTPEVTKPTTAEPAKTPEVPRAAEPPPSAAPKFSAVPAVRSKTTGVVATHEPGKPVDPHYNLRTKLLVEENKRGIPKEKFTKVQFPGNVEHGWLDMNGKFHRTAVEVARAKIEHEGGQHAVPKRSPETVPMGTPPGGGQKVEPRTSKPEGATYVQEQQKGQTVTGQGEVKTPQEAQRPLPKEGVQPEGGGVPQQERKPGDEGRIVPAVREGGKVHEGLAGDTHDKIMARAKATGAPFSDKAERGFRIGGKWVSREEAAKITGLQTFEEPGKLHSADLVKQGDPKNVPFKQETEPKPSKGVPQPTAESGFIDLGAVHDALKDIYGEKVAPTIKGFADAWKRQSLRRSGESLPYHASVNKELGDAAYRVGQAPGMAERLAEVDPKIVLNGEKVDSEFDHKVGAVWTEVQLRDKRSQLLSQGKTAEAAAVTSEIGKGVIKDEAEFQSLLRDKKIQEATKQMKRWVGNQARERHIKLGGQLAQEPGMGFINLLVKQEPKLPTTSGLRGAQLKKSAFSMARTGTGTGYDTSATRIMQNMIRGNYYRAALKDYYVKAEQKGIGKWVKGGETPPEGFSAVPQDVTRLIIKEEGEPTIQKTLRRDFYIRDDMMPEFRRVTNLDKGAIQAREHQFADFLTKIQVEAGVDALGHTGNIVAAVNSAARPSLGKNIIGAREISTLTDITKTVGQSMSDNPEFLKLAHEMAEQGIVRQHGTMEGIFGKRSIGASAIKKVDTAGRAVLYKLAQEAAAKGLGTKDPVLIRRQIDKQLGQYNPRLMTAWQHIMRSTFSPFSIASRTFNSLATHRLLMSPGFAAANRTAWTKLAARQMAYAATAYFAAPMILNYQQTGQVAPEGVKFGEGVIGKNEDGSYETFDFLKLNFLRRGLRITGLGRMAEEQVMPRIRGETPASMKQTLHEAGSDIVHGVMAPYTTGPVPRAAVALATGKTPEGYELRAPGETEGPYGKAALRTLNPVTGALMMGGETGEGVKPLKERFEKMVGVQASSKPEQTIGNLRRQFLYKIGKVKQADFTPSAYIPMVNALKQGDIDTAKEEYKKLFEEHMREHTYSKDPEGDTKKQFQEYFEKYAKGHGNASKEDEAAFVRGLTPHQRELYDKVQEQNRKVADVFFGNIQAAKPKGGFKFSLKF